MSPLPHLDTPETLADWLLHRFFEDKAAKVADNYDAARFSFDGVDRSNQPYTDLHVETMKELLRETAAIHRAYQLLSDPYSQSLFLDLMRYRLAGHKHVKLPTNCADFWQRQDGWRAVSMTPSRFALPNEQNWPIWHYEIEFENKKLKIDSTGPTWPFLHRQYFYDRDGVKIAPRAGDHVVDAGACLGDTALAFGAAAGAEGCVYLFDLLEIHHQVATHNIAQNPSLSRFKSFHAGLSDKVFTPSVSEKGPQAYAPGLELPPNNETFPTTTIDHLVATGEIERVDFIKMDIEGAEMKALRGAAQTIQKFRPRLAISLYHRISDFHEIPLFLDSINCGYHLHLNHYTIHVGETVLYATAE